MTKKKVQLGIRKKVVFKDIKDCRKPEEIDEIALALDFQDGIEPCYHVRVYKNGEAIECGYLLTFKLNDFKKLVVERCSMVNKNLDNAIQLTDKRSILDVTKD